MNSNFLKLQNLFLHALTNILQKIDPDDVAEILDNRDASSFSDLLTTAFEEVEDKIANLEEKSAIDDMRKEVFMRTYSKTKSDDLAAYLSDDFELISAHLLNSDENKWISSLCAAYLDEKIPQGKLVPNDKTVNELIKNIK